MWEVSKTANTTQPNKKMTKNVNPMDSKRGKKYKNALKSIAE